MSQVIEVETTDGIRTVTFNRPEVLNAINAELRGHLIEALAPVNSDDGIRAVVLTGAGDRAFCAGQDLDETRRFDSSKAVAWVEDLRAFYSSIRDLDKPCVAAINGIAAGAGLQIALYTDIRVGHAGTRMGQPEVSAGLPSVLGSRLLELGFGLARSVELSLTGRLVAAEECLQIGLINHLVDKNKLLFESKAIAGDLAQKPPGAMRLTKQRYRAVTQAAYDEMYQAAAHLQTEAYGSGEPQAVMDAFIARRARKR